MAGLTGTNERLSLQVLGGPYLTGYLSKGKKHINLVETSYLMSLKSHIALIFFFSFFFYLSLPWLRFLLVVEGISLKPFAFALPGSMC